MSKDPRLRGEDVFLWGGDALKDPRLRKDDRVLMGMG